MFCSIGLFPAKGGIRCFGKPMNDQLRTSSFAKVSGGGIRLLSLSDIPAAMRLKEAANWNQTEQDWERVLALEPEGCFGLEWDGTLAASTTVLTYGDDLAWIGMVLTLPEFRKRGCGYRMMEQAMDFCQLRKIKKVGLDATDMGFPLYRRFGFEPECIVERWERPATADPVEGVVVDPWELDSGLDSAAFGVDRSRLLKSLSSGESASIRGLGYAMGRPGSKAVCFGPAVAKSAHSAGTLLRWFLSHHPQAVIYWDILAGNAAAVLLAKQYGFHPIRRLTRMVRTLRAAKNTVPANDYSKVFAIAGFELG